MKPFKVRLAKNQFKCFHCRSIFSQKDGDWFNWDQMQVHLCHPCEKLTAAKPERRKLSSAYPAGA